MHLAIRLTRLLEEQHTGRVRGVARLVLRFGKACRARVLSSTRLLRPHIVIYGSMEAHGPILIRLGHRRRLRQL